jgi:hypothetical protein
MNYYAPQITKVASLIEKCILMLNDYQIRAAKSFASFDSKIRIACEPSTKVSQIFSKKQAVIGDGKTKETAFHFHKARTHFEALEAYYAFLKAQKINPDSRRKLAGIESGYLFETLETKNGTLWFKYLLR